MTKPTTLVEDKFLLDLQIATARNVALLRVAMEMLYGIYITSESIALIRGEAIRAINEMAMSLGGPKLSSEFERDE